jgi:hypothetical protein
MKKNMKQGTPKLSSEEWVDILRLATMWDMDVLRTFVVDHLTLCLEDHTHAALKVRAALDYGVERWKCQGFLRLVTRKSILSAADIRLLGPDLAALVLQERRGIITTQQIDEMKKLLTACTFDDCDCKGIDPVQRCAKCEEYILWKAHTSGLL